MTEEKKMPGLSPPWYTLWNKIKYSIGNDTAVTVNQLDTKSSPYIVPITVADHDKAVAIASVMILRHQMGNITVDVQVKDGAGKIVSPETPESAEKLAELLKKALGDNAWFVEVVVMPSFQRGVVFPVFKKAVIQFFNDDLSDLYRNYNNVVGFVFREVLNPGPGGIPILCSTDKNL